MKFRETKYTKHIENANTKNHPFVVHFNPSKASKTIAKFMTPKHPKPQPRKFYNGGNGKPYVKS